jgi:peptidoglycan/LPS O-acetylase OafA/YrhL
VQSPNRRYIVEVDELRGIAALLVFFYHSVHQGHAAIGGQGWLFASFPLTALLYEGHTGVSLFMVLSGFILAKGTFNKPLDYKRFLINRVLRIFPLMVFVNVFAIYASKNYTLEGVLAPFLFLYNTPFRINDLTQLSATTWAVSVEFQFYLVAPFLFMFVARRGLLGYVLPAAALILAVEAYGVISILGCPAGTGPNTTLHDRRPAEPVPDRDRSCLRDRPFGNGHEARGGVGLAHWLDLRN